MGVKYVKDFSFPSSGGFHGDVQRYAKGGHVTKVPAKAKASVKDVPARAKPNAPARGAPKMASKPAKGKRQGYNEGGRVPGYEMDRLPTKRPPGRGMDLAPARRFKGDYQGYAEGGPVDEILPGDGRGGLEAVPMPKPKPMGNPYYDIPDNFFVPELPTRADRPPLEEPNYNDPRYIGPGQLISEERLRPEDLPELLRPKLQQTPIDKKLPVDELKPLPEEPQYLVPEEPVPYREVRSGPRMERWSDGTYNYLPEHTGQRTPLGSLPDYYRRLNQEVFKAERGANRREMVGARGDRQIPVFKKGGEVKGKKIAKVMGEYKRGELRSGSKKGPKVTNPKQAMAIALSEAGASKKAKGGIFNDEGMAYESKGPKTRYSAARSRREAKERATERRALNKARYGEKHAPGLSLDMYKYKKGGKVKHSDVKMDKKLVKSAVHKHESAMHPGKPKTKLRDGGVPSYGRKPMYGGGKC